MIGLDFILYYWRKLPKLARRYIVYMTATTPVLFVWILVPYLMLTTGLDVAEAGLVLSIASALAALTNLVVGRVLDKAEPVVFMALIGVIEGVAYIIYMYGFLLGVIALIVAGAVIERIARGFYTVYAVYEYDAYPEGTESGYRRYVAVEPEPPPPELFMLIEEKLATVITENDVARDLEERRRILLEKVKLVTEVVDAPVDYASLLPRIQTLARVPVYRNHYDNMIYYLLRNKADLGILEPLIKDPYIEDISCPGVGYIYIVHKVFGPLETNLKFNTAEELDRFIIELSERIGKPVSHARPIVDATLPDGSRINIVFGSDVSLQGSNFTIRRVAKIPLSVTQLVNWNTFDERVAAYLWILLLEGSSGFISGGNRVR